MPSWYVTVNDWLTLLERLVSCNQVTTIVLGRLLPWLGT